MYNRYLPEVPAGAPQMQKHPDHSRDPGASGIFQLQNQAFRPDADTLIALAVIWFLLSDGEIVHTDILMIAAVLLLLGL